MKAILIVPLIFFAHAALAQQAEKKAPGPGEATSETKQDVSNAGLTGKVKTALASDVGLGTVTSINVDSDNGVVTLKGHVDSADKKAKAEEIAKKVDGVKSVKNELRVEPAKDKSS